MKIEIEILGSDREIPRKGDIQKNIDALNRYKNGKQNSTDFVLLMDTIYLLEGIKRKLP